MTDDKLPPSLSLPAQDLLESVPAGVMVLDPNQRLLFVNQWLVDRTGRSLERLLDHPITDILASDGHADAELALAALFSEGRTVSWEATLVSGVTETVAEFTAQPVYEKERVVAAQAYCRDVTPYHRALTEAAHSREDLERQRREMDALYSIGISCALTMNLEETLRLLYLHVGNLFTFTTFSILLYDAPTGQVSSELVVRDGTSLPRRCWPLDKDRGLSGLVIRNARPVLVGNWPEEADQLSVDGDGLVEDVQLSTDDSHATDPDARSWLAVPLGGKEHVLGAICLQHRDPDAYDQADQRSLFRVADQATMVIENVRLHEQTEQQLHELQQANREMQALQDLGRMLQSSLDLHNVLSIVVNGVASWLDYDLVVLATMEESSSSLTVRAVAAGTDRQELYAPLSEISWPILVSAPEATSSLVVQAANSAQIATTESLYELVRPEIDRGTADRVQESLQIRSLVTAPLLSRDRLVGNLIVGTARSQITDQEIGLLGAFAAQSAMAVENAQLYEVQRRRVAQLEAVRDLGQSISSFLNLDELLANTARILRERFGYGLVCLYLRDHKEDVLTLEAHSPVDAVVAKRSLPLGEDPLPLVSSVAVHGASRMINNISGDHIEAARETGSELAVPIWFGDRILGVIDVQHAQANQFDESDLFILESLSNQVAARIESTRLYDTVNKQLAEVSTLYMLADQISSSLETSVVLDSVTDILKRVLNCRGCVIFLLDDQRESLSIQVSSGVTPYWQQHTRMRVGEGVAGLVAQTGRPRYIADLQSEPDLVIFDPAVRSLLVVPLIYKGQVIGTLNVDDDKPNAFTGDVERLLSIAATQAAVAIQNAKLYEALKERAEKLAKAHRELQEDDRLRSEFVQNMSHELRTPLTFVKNYVELFLAGTLGPMTDRQRDSMQIVSERTDQVIQLVTELLTLQQMEQGGMRFGVARLDEIAHVEVQGARAMAEQAGLALVEDYAPDLSPVFGDASRLDRVFANLIGNAIKYSPDGGTITVRLSNAGSFVQAEVIDQGIGIAKEMHDRIFERFFQVDGSSKRRYGGAGLGLAIVKEIVEAHGGEITVLSELEAGSTFRFTVPRATTELVRSVGLMTGAAEQGND